MFNKLISVFSESTNKSRNVDEKCCKCHKTFPFNKNNFIAYIDNVKVPIYDYAANKSHKPDNMDLYCADCPNPKAKLKCSTCGEIKPANLTHFSSRDRGILKFTSACKPCLANTKALRTEKQRQAKGVPIVAKKGITVSINDQIVNLNSDYCIWKDAHTLLINLEKMYHELDKNPSLVNKGFVVKGVISKKERFNIYNKEEVIPVIKCNTCKSYYVDSKDNLPTNTSPDCRKCLSKRNARYRNPLFKTPDFLRSHIKVYQDGHMDLYNHKVTFNDEEVKIIFNKDEDN